MFPETTTAVFKDVLFQEIARAREAKSCTQYVAAMPANVSVAFHSDACDHDWITRYLQPYMVLPPAPIMAPTWRVFFATATANTWSAVEHLFHNPPPGVEKQAYVDDDVKILRFAFSEMQVFFQYVYDQIYQGVCVCGNEIFVFAPDADGERFLFVPMRVIRNLMTLAGLNQGRLHLHASGVIYKDRAFLFLGEKFAGKTTLLLALIEKFDCVFLTNDQVLVCPVSGDVSGIPLAVGVRRKTMSMFPRLGDYVQTHTLLHHNHNRKYKGEKLVFAPGEIGHAFAAPLVAGARLGGIFLIQLDLHADDLAQSTFAEEDAVALLRQNAFSQVSENQPFWDEYRLGGGNVDGMCRQIAASYPVMKIRHNSLVLEQLVSLFEKWLTR